MIYLDNAATTFPKPNSVYDDMDYINRNLCVNAGRGSYRLAREANEIIGETKDLLRKLVKARNDTPVVFSPSITVAMNQIINGLLWPTNATVYISPYEHNAVARTINLLAQKHSISIKLLPLNVKTLEIDIDKTRYEFSRNHPSAIFCTHISNVNGYILPIKSIFEAGRMYGSINVLDSAQSLGLLDIDVENTHVDIVAFTGHKSLYGPFGIGGFINVSNLPLNEFIVGGTGSNSLNLNMPDDLESKYEASSCNLTAVAGLRAALRILNRENIYKKEVELTNYLINSLDKIKNVKMLLPSDRNTHIGIVSFVVDSMESGDVGMILDEDFDIAVRTGYHCAPYIHEYLSDKKYLGTVRIGLGQFNTKGDIDTIVKALETLK